MGKNHYNVGLTEALKLLYIILDLSLTDFMLPKILVTSPVFEIDEGDIPSITVTREMDEEDYNSNAHITDESESITVDTNNLYPPSIYLAAKSTNPQARSNVEVFIQSRLASITSSEKSSSCKCSRISEFVEEWLECPVCRDRVGKEVYQCHRGHLMCASCRVRLLTCPVCRSLLTLPAIRNRAVEQIVDEMNDLL